MFAEPANSYKHANFYEQGSHWQKGKIPEVGVWGPQKAPSGVEGQRPLC